MKQSVNPSSPRKKYDRIFKQDAVQLWRASGKSATFMAEELGLKPNEAWPQTDEELAMGIFSRFGSFVDLRQCFFK